MSWDLADVDTLKRMVCEGATAEEVSLAVKKPRRQVEAMAEVLSLSFCEDGAEWCDRCCSPRPVLDPFTGWCLHCTAMVKLEKQRQLDEEEEERLRREAIRSTNAQKKARERMREEFDANPRKGKHQ